MERRFFFALDSSCNVTDFVLAVDTCGPVTGRYGGVPVAVKVMVTEVFKATSTHCKESLFTKHFNHP